MVYVFSASSASADELLEIILQWNINAHTLVT